MFLSKKHKSFILSFILHQKKRAPLLSCLYIDYKLVYRSGFPNINHELTDLKNIVRWSTNTLRWLKNIVRW